MTDAQQTSSTADLELRHDTAALEAHLGVASAALRSARTSADSTSRRASSRAT